jgi:hypothetical protein
MLATQQAANATTHPAVVANLRVLISPARVVRSDEVTRVRGPAIGRFGQWREGPGERRLTPGRAVALMPCGSSGAYFNSPRRSCRDSSSDSRMILSAMVPGAVVPGAGAHAH